MSSDRQALGELPSSLLVMLLDLQMFAGTESVCRAGILSP